MKLKITIPRNADLIPDDRLLSEAAAAGVSDLVIEHLRAKNQSTTQRQGFPKTNYYLDAANSVTTAVSGGKAEVSIDKEGIRLHYYGGVVKPKKKALAIPVDPIVAGIWPSERGGNLVMLKDKENNKLYLKDPETDSILYQLVPSVRIKEDKSVLPSDDAIVERAQEMMAEALFL